MPTNDPTTGTPPMIGRQLSVPAWLNYIAAYQFGATTPTRVVLHHTFSPTVPEWAGLRSMQGMQRFYAQKGWTAAPHIYVAPDGIWLFTPLKDVGIHAGTGNSGAFNGKFWYSIGVEMVGVYDQQRPSGAVWEDTKAVLGGLSKRLGIAPRQLISFHRDYTTLKSCPGWAVTKDWVAGEVDAWLANRPAPPAPPPGPIGNPTPTVEALVELLMDQSYSRRGEGYNGDWAFHQYAAQQSLGFPIGKSALVQVAGGATYAYQAFARDTLYNQVPNWGDVQRMSALLIGGVPTGGLARTLLDATFRAGAATFHPDWAFHQYVLANKLGPPIGESANITVDGAQYSYQVFALDTLYNRVPNWTAVQRVSDLAGTTNPAMIRLRDALLAQTYARAGATYHPDWAFHQLARGWNLGAPLSDSYRVAAGVAQYAIQIYATDTLYNIVPNWSDVRRLSLLIAPRASILALGSLAPADALLSANTRSEPGSAPFHILHYAESNAAPTAFSARDGSRIALIVLHGDTVPAKQTLAAMAALGAQSSTHYYVTAAGAIYQLVDDATAAWHSGMADWAGRRQNINRISLGVTLEHAPSGYSAALLDALAWLIQTLRTRYGLEANSVLRWGDLDPAHSEDPAGFPWAQFQKRLGR